VYRSCIDQLGRGQFGTNRATELVKIELEVVDELLLRFVVQGEFDVTEFADAGGSGWRGAVGSLYRAAAADEAYGGVAPSGRFTEPPQPTRPTARPMTISRLRSDLFMTLRTFLVVFVVLYRNALRRIGMLILRVTTAR